MHATAEQNSTEKQTPLSHRTPSNERPKSDDAAPRDLHGFKWALAYTAMLSTTFLFALDNTIVADIQPSILRDFDNIELLPWIGTGFALGTTAILPWGKAYGIFNIRWLYIFNILLFEVGSAICGAAPNINALIVGRVIAGIGGSGMYSGTLMYVSLLTSTSEKAAYLSGSTVVWGFGSVLGPVVGGAFAISSATWRWGFYVNLVVGAVFAPAYLFLFPTIDPQPGKTFSQRLRMVDWGMVAVFLAGAASLTLAISFGGLVYPFRSGPIIALYVLAAVFLVVSVLLLKFHPGIDKANRLYPAHFFKSPILVNMQVQVFLSSGIILAMTYYIPLYFQFVRGDGPLEAGIRLLPLIVFMVVVAMLNGVFLPKIPWISPWYIGGSGLALIGSALMITVHENTPNANIYGYTILVGTGIGCYVVAGFAIVQSLVPASDILNAVASMTISQDLGMVLFLAISGSIFQNIAVQKIASVLPAATEAEIAQLMAGTSSAAYKALDKEQQAAVISEIIKSLQNIWTLFTAAAALSFVLSVPLARRRLSR